MKTVAVRLDDATITVLEEKARQQEITVSEYLRQQICPLIEGTKPLSLEQCLAKLDFCLSSLHFCVKPLQDLAVDLQKFDAELLLKQVTQALKQVKEEKPDEPSQIEPQTATTPA